MRVIALAIGSSVFALDLLTKWWVKSTIRLHYYPVIEGFFKIEYVRNRGIAFGMFNSVESEWKPIILTLIAFLAVIVVIYYLATTPQDDRITFVALGLLLGGILGNSVDRLSQGFVVDFLTLHWQNRFAWPTFNIADASISCGVFLILIKTFVIDLRQHRTAGLLLFCFLAGSGVVRGQGDPVLRLQDKYEEIESFRAEFQQIFRSRGLTREEEGIVMMKRPGKMYWEYTDPHTKYFVTDGSRSYFYVPRDHQVLVSDLNLSKAGSPLLFLVGRGNIERDFLVSREEEAEQSSLIRLRLTPKVPQADYSYLVLEIEPDSFLIRSLTVVEPIGQENEYRLRDFQENVQIPDRMFKLKIPSDVEVIEQ